MLITNIITKGKPFTSGINIVLYRNGHTIRGKRPGVAKSLEQRLAEELNSCNPNPFPKIDIGFLCKSRSRKEVVKSRIDYIKKKRSDPSIEKLSRTHNLIVDLEQVRKDSAVTATPNIIRKMANHFGIYKDLFGNAFFIPRINMEIIYSDINSKKYSVHHGNILSASCSIAQPKVTFNNSIDLLEKPDKSEISYFSILMVNPDTHLFNENHETCLNWFISNIPNNEIKKGEEICTYMQSIPVKGFGYQRNVFLLFKQIKKIDFANLKIDSSDNLNDRKFNLLEFYKKYQDEITPVGLSFFQSEWDQSVTDFFHKRNMKEPVFIYDFPKPYLAEQKWFPLKQPFNSYLDKHRTDPDKINKEYLKPFLFKDLDIPIKYPMAHPIKNVPSWMVTEIKKERLKLMEQKQKTKLM